MTTKIFSVTVLVLATPLLIGSAFAMFHNPIHIFTTAVMALLVGAALFEPDDYGENLYTTLKRVFRGQ